MKVQKILLTALAAATVFACKPPEPVEVTGVSLDKATLTLVIDASEQLTATIKPNDAADKSLTWTSSDNSVATVEDGLVTAVSEGEAIIMVETYNGKTAECVVTVVAVEQPVAVIVINEVYSRGGYFTDEGENYGEIDWVELYNNSYVEGDVSGFLLYDDEAKVKKVTLPEGTKIPANGFLVVEVDIDGGFGLSSNGDQVYLENADGEVIDHIEFGALAADQAYARKPDGSANWVIQTPSRGVTNSSVTAKPIISNLHHTPASPTTAEPDVVFIAEIVAGDGELTVKKLIVKLGSSVDGTDTEMVPAPEISPNAYKVDNFAIRADLIVAGLVVNYTVVAENSAGGHAEKSGTFTYRSAGIDYSVLVINEIDGNGKFVEIYNKSNNAVNLNGVTLVKNGSVTWWSGGDVTIAAQGYYTVANGGNAAATEPNGGTNGISAKQNVKFELKAPDNSPIDEFVRTNGGALGDEVAPDYSKTTPKYSFARCPDGTGAFGLAVPSCNAANPATSEGAIETN